LPFSEQHAVSADGLLKGSPAQFPSNLPAPPRVSNLLPPPPRVGTQHPGIDSRTSESISNAEHDRAKAHPAVSRLMSDKPILPGLVAGGGWLPPRQSQRGINERHSSWLHSHGDGPPPHRGRGRHPSSDKWRYRRTWHNLERNRSYPSMHQQRVSSEAVKSTDEMEEAAACMSDAGSVGESSLKPSAALSDETASVARDKECTEVSSSSTVCHVDTVTSSS